MTLLNVFTNSIADHDMKACWRKINNVRYKPKTIKLYKKLYKNKKLYKLISGRTKSDEISSTLIYLIIINCPKILAIFNVFMNSIADHDMIACSRKINNIRYKQKSIKCRNYKNYSLE